MKLKIASYNIRKAVGLDRRRDPARILRVLAGLNADIVVLQEADRRLGQRPAALPKDLIDQASEYRAVELSRNDVSLGWHGNAILVRRDIKILQTHHITLPGLEPRGAVAIDLGQLFVVGAHLGLLRSSRRRQMTAISEAVGDRATRTVIRRR